MTKEYSQYLSDKYSQYLSDNDINSVCFLNWVDVIICMCF